MTFKEKLEAVQNARDSLICVGLDPDPWIPEGNFIGQTLTLLNIDIIDRTFKCASAYKLDASYYRAHGVMGLTAAIDTVTAIRQRVPETPIIWDAKYSGTRRANERNAIEAFDVVRADAVTVTPYFDRDAFRPFLEHPGRGVFAVCKSSENSDEFQDLPVTFPLAHTTGTITMPLYRCVAHQVSSTWWNDGTCGLVVGATHPDGLRSVREIIGDDMLILIPGGGEYQKGSVGAAVRAGINSRRAGILMNFSRQIGLSEDPRKEIERLRKDVNTYRRERWN
ncbi:MAG TPA: orotidine-5'-phosphate decarboxylase [Candidatus Paceibacterota bacterium]|nr:orotidine-5'-phosphate decarboxylase [Candidatus Paceibacterota bacterium]